MGGLRCWGGCSRCDHHDEPTPLPPRQDVFIRLDNDTFLPELFSIYLKWPRYDTTNIVYSYTTQYLTFVPVDTSYYKNYRYRFIGSGQVFKGRKIVSIYYNTTELTDTVELSCWNDRDKDTISSKRAYYIRPVCAWPVLGTYRGRLNFLGDIHDNIEIKLYCAHRPDLIHTPILKASGILQSGCGYNLDLEFIWAGAYGTGGGLLQNNGFISADTITGPCRLSSEIALGGSQLYTFPTSDSLHFFLNGKAYPTNQDMTNLNVNITFKGKKI